MTALLLPGCGKTEAAAPLPEEKRLKGAIHTMAKPQPTWVDCPGVINEGAYGHSLRDNCWTCAPWWARYPSCPTHHRKLAQSGWCRDCRRYYKVTK